MSPCHWGPLWLFYFKITPHSLHLTQHPACLLYLLNFSFPRSTWHLFSYLVMLLCRCSWRETLGFRCCSCCTGGFCVLITTMESWSRWAPPCLYDLHSIVLAHAHFWRSHPPARGTHLYFPLCICPHWEDGGIRLITEGLNFQMKESRGISFSKNLSTGTELSAELTGPLPLHSGCPPFCST